MNWPTATFGLRRPSEGEGGGLARGFGPSHPGPARPRRRSHATPAFQMPRWRGRCQRAGGHCRPGPGKRASARAPQESAEPEQATQKDGGGKEDAFHGGAKHGGAMTDGGETCKMLYLGSKGVIAASTRCQRARWS